MIPLKDALDIADNLSDEFQSKLLPDGGLAREILLKNSTDDWDRKWDTLEAGDIPNITLAKITDSGDAAGKNVGTGSGDVAAGNHDHSGTYEPVLDANQKRTITAGTADPTGGSDGDIYMQYED